MIDGKRVIAFTPSGRQRYMDVLTPYVVRDHNAGVIDEWFVFNNTYTDADQAYTRGMTAALGNWVSVLEFGDNKRPEMRNAGRISRFYPQLANRRDCIFVRLDDDLCFINEGAIEALVRDKIANPTFWLLYPTIVVNTRMSYLLQQHGHIPEEWAKLTDLFLEPTAWRDPAFNTKLHDKALTLISEGRIAELQLPALSLTGRSSEGTFNSHLSINAFAISGTDMHEAARRWPNRNHDEEGYLSDTMPTLFNRCNGISANSLVIHFAYHPFTVAMEATGALDIYKRLAANPGEFAYDGSLRKQSGALSA